MAWGPGRSGLEQISPGSSSASVAQDSRPELGLEQEKAWKGNLGYLDGISYWFFAPMLAKITGCSLIGVLTSGVAALASVAAVGVAQPACAADSYPEAVQFSRQAAKAVLNQDGRETCLRGKLTKALLKLSDSCDASGQKTSLCSLAGKAAVVTPMSLTFMEDTSRKLLELSDQEAGGKAQGAK
jgi:hypothetical protein